MTQQIDISRGRGVGGARMQDGTEGVRMPGAEPYYVAAGRETDVFERAFSKPLEVV